jgi:hypothetical protein
MAAKPTAKRRALRSSLFTNVPSDDPDSFARAFETVENVGHLLAAMFCA